MNDQNQENKSNRRDLLKFSGIGVLGGLAAHTLTPNIAQGDIIEPITKLPITPIPLVPIDTTKIVHASWIHGHSMHIEYPDKIQSQRRIGYAFRIVGKSGLTNWLHYAIPTPVIINDVRLKLDSVMLDFTTGSVDAFVRDVHVYDGAAKIAYWNDLGWSESHRFERLVLNEPLAVGRGIGISIGIGVGVEMMDHTMDFIAAGADFTV
ncbi:DUF6623 family protein [Planctomycetota bacterium]